MVGLGNVDNTTDLLKPISTATQTALNAKADASALTGLATASALNAKAPLASPTFTGTVSGITSSMVGLGNVDNTTDLLKPISTATQTALGLKLNSSDSVLANRITNDRVYTDALGATKLSISDSTLASRVTADRNFVNNSLTSKLNSNDSVLANRITADRIFTDSKLAKSDSVLANRITADRVYTDALGATKSPLAGSTSITTLGTIATGTWNGTAIAVANGGTGLTSTPSNGQIAIGNGSGYTLGTLTAGEGISITNGSGSVTVATSGISINNFTKKTATYQMTATDYSVFVAPTAITTITLPLSPNDGQVFVVTLSNPTGLKFTLTTPIASQGKNSVAANGKIANAIQTTYYSWTFQYDAATTTYYIISQSGTTY
jgi:hypothetical protein